MKVRSKILTLLCLLALVAAWYFWPRAGSVAPVAQKTAGPTAVANIPAAPVAATNAVTAVDAGKLSAAATNRLAYRLVNTPKSVKELAVDRHAILLENAFIDTQAKLDLKIPTHLKAANEPGAFIVQSRGVIDAGFRSAIAGAGGKVVSYIPNNALLVQLSSAGASVLAENSHVQAVLPYEPYYKVQSTLLGLAVNQKPLPAGTYLTLGLFGDGVATVAQLEKLGAQILSRDRSPFGSLVRVKPPTDWIALANLPGVQLVEPAYRRKAANDLSRVAVGVTTNTTDGATNNYLGLTGKNVLVEVNDTGIDPTHPDFTLNVGGGATRVTGDSTGSLSDTDGHGTHVAGIIAGNGTESFTVTNARGSVTNANFRGKAPDAMLYSVGGIVGGNDTNFLTDDSYLQETPALTNALISNNSWGYGGDTTYDLAAASYDAAVRDALPETTGPQPVLFVFAAGNDGGGNDSGSGGTADSVSSPGTAKNVITVGALEELRNITNVVTSLDGTSNAIWSAMTDSGFQVAWYSSRGNVGVQTEGEFGRFKPDVVAPGTFTISTRSMMWDQQAYYNRTNYHQNVVGDFVTTNTLAYGFISIPQNAVGLTIQVVPTGTTSTNFPVYVSSSGVPDPTDATTYDILKTDGFVSIPPDIGGAISGIGVLQNGGVIYAVGDPTNTSLSFDVIETIITTNDLGNQLEVLSNLNNTISPYYRYESGTSMATPAVSGVLALMQDFFTNTLHALPSPALLKAMTINGARLTGNYKFAVTNTLNFEGWGLVKLPNSIPSALTNATPSGTNGIPLFFVDQSPTNTVATGDRRTWNVSVASTAARAQALRVTLAWTDPPGNPAAAVKLVNDLDLVVTNLDSGQVFYGNQFAGSGTPPYSTAGDSNSIADNINNVENIFLAPSLGTNYSITVFGHAVNVNAVTLEQTNIVQDFALVVSCGDGSNTNGFTITTAAPTLGVIAPKIDYLAPTNGIYFNQYAGANAPWLSTNDINFGASNPYNFFTNSVFHAGQSNQWHFYVITNMFAVTNSSFTNAAFIVFLPNTAALPREGVFGGTDLNSTRLEADLEILVSSAQNSPLPGLANAGALTNLDAGVISNCLFNASGCGSSIGRGGSEFVAFNNSQPGQVYYIGVQCQDQMAGQFGFVPIFSDKPFSTQDTNGNVYVNGINMPVNIPDGNNAHPGVGYVFGLALQPVEIKRVIATNTFTHENFGDLFGAVSHAGQFATLNNHDGLGAVDPSRQFIYDDSLNNGTANSIHSDGPGSLNNFRGKQGVGLWQLTEVDDSFSQTGAVTSFQLKIEPHRDLRHQPFAIVTVPAGGWFYDYVDVAAGYTNLLVLATNISLVPALTPPVQLFVKEGDLPTLTDTNYTAFLSNGVPPGCTVSVGPPLVPDRYWVGLYNASGSDQTVLIGAKLSFSALAIVTVDYPSQGGVLNLLDDAVTYDSIFITTTQAVQNFNVGLRVDHQRISDLVFHLIQPDGTRYLLMENRGGQTTNGCGVTIITTNIVDVTANGNALAETNTFSVGVTHGTFPITYNFYTAPDEMTVYYGTNVSPAYLIYDTGLTNNPPLGPGAQNTQPETFVVNFPPAGISADSTFLTIVMNQYGNTNRRTAWVYTAGGVLTNYAYLNFTEDTNLTQTPIKFAVPPFIPQTVTNIYYSTNFSYTTNLAAVTNLVYTTNITYVTNVNLIATNMTLSGFESSSTAITYTLATPVDGWTVISNQVNVVNDVSNSLAGSQFLALANGSLSRNLSTPIGSTNTVSFLCRGPGIVSWYRGESNLNDSVSGLTGTWKNSAAYGTGEVGTGLTYDNVSRYMVVQTPTNSALDVGKGGRFTIEAWIYPTNLSASVNRPLTQFERILFPSSGSDVYLDFFVSEIGASGRLYANIGDINGNAHTFNSASGIVTTNSWQHVALTYDAGTGLGTMYRNGVSVAQQSLGNFMPRTTFTNFLIGARTYTGTAPTPADKFAGTIDELSVYNRALSVSELKAIYTAGGNGKFDSSGIIPQSLAEATLSIIGKTTLYTGENNTWQTNTFTFVATTNPTVLKVRGVQPGMLVDAFALSGNLAVTNITPVATNVVVTTNVLPILPTNIPVLWGPVQYTNNNHYYCLFQTNTWTASEAWAVACGGHLTTVNDAAEDAWIGNQFSVVGGEYRDMWIGLWDTNNDTSKTTSIHGTNFVWVNGETASYRNWRSGEPNNGGSASPDSREYWGYKFPVGYAGYSSVAGLWNDFTNIVFDTGLLFIAGVAEINTLPVNIVTNITYATNIVVTTSNLCYLPEQDISGIQTINPYGLWKLEILDNRAGGGLTNSLVSWQLELQYANTNITVPPVLPTLATNYSIIESNLLVITNTATYWDTNATLLYTLVVSSGVTNATISTNGIISWTPTEAQGPGSYIFVTTVHDAANALAVAQNFFQVDVLESNLPPVILFPTNNAVIRILETEPFLTNVIAYDPDIPTNTLTFGLAGSQNVSGPGISTNDFTIDPQFGTISWLPAETNGPSTNIIFITVTDTNPPAINQKSFTVTNRFTLVVMESNLPPVLTLPPNTNITELLPWTAQATATDSDWPSNQLTFSLASGPAGLTVSPAGVINWTPTELQGPGDYIVAINVTDTNPWAVNQQSFTVTGTLIIHVDEWNIAPTLPALPDTNIFELQTLTVNNSATDPDVPFNTLTYTLIVTPLATNAPAVTNAFISVFGIVTWIPTEAQGPGDYLFTTIVTDTNPPAINTTSFSATNKFIVYVLETNSAPFWPTNYSDVVMDELTVTNIFATAIDTDLPPNTVTYSLATNTPAWVSINATNGAIVLSPLEVDGPSTNIITVIATDNGAPPLSGSTNFTVVVNEVNTAPYWLTNVPSQTNYITPALWTLVVTNTAVDLDIPANLLTYTFSVVSTNPLDPPVTNALMGTNGIFVWTPTEAQAPAVYLVTTVVTDTNPWALFNQSLSATNTFIVTVVPKNLAPFWTTNYSDVVMNEQTTTNLSSTVVDLNIPTNSWTYALSNNTPTWVSINTNSGVITLAPQEVDGPSTNIITVIVTDNGLPPLSSATNFTVVVNEVNTPPVPPNIPDQLVYAGEEIVVDASAYDFDVPVNALTYTKLAGPAGLVLNPTNGLITWTPTTNDVYTTNLVTVTATDTNPWALFNQSLSTNYSFYITVLPPFTNPIVTGIPAFTGAEGAGGFAVGGRGGDVYHVVNTNDDGPGSLRYGTRASHRTIVFDVSGTIDLLSDLRITRQYLTIAGQTAPGDGITLKGRLTSVQNTHDVEVRFLHFRPGDVNCPTFQDDAFHFRSAAMSIVDHVSASWSIDEVLSATYVTNVTVQWSMIADSLNDSCHVKGLHGYGSLLRYGDGNVSFHHNLYADNYSRNPRLGDNLTLDFVNNVVANWGELPGYSGDSADLADNPLGFTNRMNYTGNYVIAGGNSVSPSRAFRSGDVTTWIYQSGNLIDANLNFSLDGANTGWGMFSGPLTQSGSPFALTPPAVTTDTAQVAYERVLAFVGANAKRDLVDSNIVSHVRSQTGHIINSEIEVGGWPALASTTLPPDYDQDGMPDYWEVTLGLNALLPSNDLDRDGDGYTDLEEYLNWLAAPHAFLLHDTHVDVDLRAVAGNTGNLTFTVANGTNGTVVLLGDGHTARFTPTAAYHGFASFSFNVNDTATGIAFGPVGVSVFVSLIDPFGANTPPVLPVQPDCLADTYVPLIVTNTATDYDIPPQLLTYALLNAPTNAAISTNGIITFIADDSQAGNIYTITTKVTDNGVPNLSATNSFQVAVSSGLTNDVPVTNFVGPNSVRFFRVKVPVNADIATNRLLFATPAGVSLWFTTNLPPSITNTTTDVELLDNSTGGFALLDTTNAPLLVPGSVYFLGVQNTNNFIEQFALKVTFHLVPFNFYISSIVQTNMSGTNGFLITWFAPTNTQFHLQWTPLLLPMTWKEMKGVISFDSYISATSSHFSFFDDGSTDSGSAPFGPTRFYRLHLLNSPTNTAPEFFHKLTTATNFTVAYTNTFVITNDARDWDIPVQGLFYSVSGSLLTTNPVVITNGVVQWTPSVDESGITNIITTIVRDNGIPQKSATNSFAVVVTGGPPAPFNPQGATNNVLVPNPALSVWVVTNSIYPAGRLTVDWYLTSTGGTPLQSGALQYTPTNHFSGSYTYWAETRDKSSGLTSFGRTPVTLVLVTNNFCRDVYSYWPQYTDAGPFGLHFHFHTYGFKITALTIDVLFATNPISVAASRDGVLIYTNNYVVSPPATLVLNYTNVDDLYFQTLSPDGTHLIVANFVSATIIATNTDCSGSITTAGFTANATNCAATANPGLSVLVSSGQSANWYADSPGANLVGRAVNPFVPTNAIPGTYNFYAQTVDTNTFFVSAYLTQVQLTLLDCLGTPPKVSLVGTNIVVSYFGNVRLQSATNLVPPISWVDALVNPYVNFTNLTWPNDGTIPIRFFRLVAP